MDKEDLLYLIALLKTENIGPVLAKNLIQSLGGIKAVFQASKRELMMIPKIGEKTSKDLTYIHQNLSEAEKIIKQCEKLGISILSYQCDEYPSILKEIYDPPLILYYKGFLSDKTWGIGVVGTRAITDYGKEQTKILTEYLVQNQVIIVSGMAYGVDYQAHRTCIDLKARTLGILACGIDTIYPKSHENLAVEIILQGGAIVSEYPPGAKVNPMNFPLRNRIISGLSKAVVIVESGEQGGALITAQFAFEQNREVWAIPGRITDKKSLGCNLLIQKNIAKIYTKPSDVLEDLKIPLEKPIKPQAQPLFLELSPVEECIYRNLDFQGMEIETLKEITQLETNTLLSSLLSLEIKGLIIQLPGKKILKKQ